MPTTPPHAQILIVKQTETATKGGAHMPEGRGRRYAYIIHAKRLISPPGNIRPSCPLFRALTYSTYDTTACTRLAS